MFMTLSGMETLVRRVHPSNAEPPMLVTPLPIVTRFRLLQPSNA